MRGKVCFVAVIGIILWIAGCASEKPKTAHEATPHEHKYPFTKVMGDYHAQLVVDHDKGQMFLLFTDITEEPVKLLRLESIYGGATLPDGTKRDVAFRSTEPLSHKFIHKYHSHMIHRRAGTYIAESDWVKINRAFDLQVTIPFEGRSYDMTYNYVETPE